MKILLLHLLFDFGLVVLIWMVQLVIYPSFKKYAKGDLIAWHTIYVKRIAIIVGSLMIAQLILWGWQLYQRQTLYTLIIFILVLFLWGFTFMYFAPVHRRISSGSFTPFALNQLEKRNWIRTVLWTLIFFLDLRKPTVTQSHSPVPKDHRPIRDVVLDMRQQMGIKEQLLSLSL